MKKILTLVLSGIGITDKENGNAIKNANMPNLNKILEEYSSTTLFASGEEIGQDTDQVGNGALAHTLIASGRIAKSNYELISNFFDNNIENELTNDLYGQNNKRIHLVGMLSDGNIHSSIDHFKKIYQTLLSKGFKDIYFHFITDGIDSEKKACLNYLKDFENYLMSIPGGKIATICGRYYAMDRDLNYDRTKIYYDLITIGSGLNVLNYESAINAMYQKDLTDEFIRPLLLDEKGLIKNGDIVLWMNYRYERSKQILQSLTDSKFNKFRIKNYEDLDVYTFLQLDNTLKNKYLIEKEVIDNPLGIYLSKLGVKQARIAELDKYQHVTSSFDAGYSGKIEECDKFQIPSYDEEGKLSHPEMNAVGVSKKIIDCMEKDYNFILANIANIDIIAHTANIELTQKACEIVDKCLGTIIEEANNNFYTLIVTSDQGNAEEMIDENGNANPMHTTNKVPFVICDNKVTLKDNGNLSNIAPTILDYMDISIPLAMTSESLLKK